MTAPRPITEADLLAFADGRLDPARRAEVEAWLAADPARGLDLAAWQLQDEAIRTLYDPVAREPVPARLAPGGLSRRLPWPALAAAAAAMLLVGGLSGWVARGLVFAPGTEAVMMRAAVTAHALYANERRHAVEVAAAEREHLTSWLSSRIESPIEAPDLSAQGFELVGGRLLPPDLASPAGPAAQLMYESAAADRVTVYVTGRVGGEDGAYEFAELDGLDAFYWANAEITCTVVGDLPEDEMRLVARQIYQQLTRSPDTRPYRG